MPAERAVWLEQLRRRFDPIDPEHRRLGHELLRAVANDREEEAERIAGELGQLAGLSPPRHQPVTLQDL